MDMYKKRLARSQQTYTQGKEDAKKNLFGPKDPGQYKLQLQAITIDDISTKNGNVLVAKIEHQIIEGPNDNDVGDVIYDSLFLEGDQSERDRTDEFITRFFNNLGYDAPENKEDLPEAFQALVAAAPVYLAKVTLTKDEQYNRVRIVRPLEEESGAADAGQVDNTEAAAEETQPEQVDEAQPEEAAAEEVVEDPNYGALVEFGTAFGLDLTAMNMEQAVAEVSKYPWDYTQLQAEEVKLLEDVGLGDKITNKPAPAPAKRALPARQAAAPAAKAAPAKAAPVKAAAPAARGAALKKKA